MVNFKKITCFHKDYQKQTARYVFRKRYPEKMKQFYRRTP